MIPTPPFSHHPKALDAKFKSASNRAAPVYKMTFQASHQILLIPSLSYFIIIINKHHPSTQVSRLVLVIKFPKFDYTL